MYSPFFSQYTEGRDLLTRMLTASPDKRITMMELMTHPWLSEGHLPFQPAPYPNAISASDINNDIVDHITDVLKQGSPIEVKQDLITNRATSLYAIYNLLASRLARYEKEFPSKAAVRPHRRSIKKKISKDLGFYDDDDSCSSDISSTISAPVRFRKDMKKSVRPAFKMTIIISLLINIDSHWCRASKETCL